MPIESTGSRNRPVGLRSDESDSISDSASPSSLSARRLASVSPSSLQRRTAIHSSESKDGERSGTTIRPEAVAFRQRSFSVDGRSSSSDSGKSNFLNAFQNLDQLKSPLPLRFASHGEKVPDTPIARKRKTVDLLSSSKKALPISSDRQKSFSLGQIRATQSQRNDDFLAKNFVKQRNLLKENSGAIASSKSDIRQGEAVVKSLNEQLLSSTSDKNSMLLQEKIFKNIMEIVEKSLSHNFKTLKKAKIEFSQLSNEAKSLRVELEKETRVGVRLKDQLNELNKSEILRDQLSEKLDSSVENRNQKRAELAGETNRNDQPKNLVRIYSLEAEVGEAEKNVEQVTQQLKKAIKTAEADEASRSSLMDKLQLVNKTKEDIFDKIIKSKSLLEEQQRNVDVLTQQRAELTLKKEKKAKEQSTLVIEVRKTTASIEDIKKNIIIQNEEISEARSLLLGLNREHTELTSKVEIANRIQSQYSNPGKLPESVLQDEVAISHQSRFLAAQAAELKEAMGSVNAFALKADIAKSELPVAMKPLLENLQENVEYLKNNKHKNLVIAASRGSMDKAISEVLGMRDHLMKAGNSAEIQTIIESTESLKINYLEVRGDLRSRKEDMVNVFAKGYSLVNDKRTSHKQANLYRGVLDPSSKSNLLREGVDAIGVRAQRYTVHRNLANPLPPKSQARASIVIDAHNAAAQVLNYTNSPVGGRRVHTPVMTRSPTEILERAKPLLGEAGLSAEVRQAINTLDANLNTLNLHVNDSGFRNSALETLLSKTIDTNAQILDTDSRIDMFVTTLSKLGININRYEFFDEKGEPLVQERAEVLFQTLKELRADVAASIPVTKSGREMPTKTLAFQDSRIHCANTLSKAALILDTLNLEDITKLNPFLSTGTSGIRNFRETVTRDNNTHISKTINAVLETSEMKTGLQKAISHNLLENSRNSTLKSIVSEDIDNMSDDDVASSWKSLVRELAKQVTDEEIIGTKLQPSDKRRSLGYIESANVLFRTRNPQNRVGEGEDDKTKQEMRELKTTFEKLQSNFASEIRRQRVHGGLINEAQISIINAAYLKLEEGENGDQLRVEREEVANAKIALSLEVDKHRNISNSMSPGSSQASNTGELTAARDHLIASTKKYARSIEAAMTNESGRQTIRKIADDLSEAGVNLAKQTGASQPTTLLYWAPRVVEQVFKGITGMYNAYAEMTFSVTSPFYAAETISRLVADAENRATAREASTTPSPLVTNAPTIDMADPAFAISDTLLTSLLSFELAAFSSTVLSSYRTLYEISHQFNNIPKEEIARQDQVEKANDILAKRTFDTSYENQQDQIHFEHAAMTAFTSDSKYDDKTKQTLELVQQVIRTLPAAALTGTYSGVAAGFHFNFNSGESPFPQPFLVDAAWMTFGVAAPIANIAMSIYEKSDVAKQVEKVVASERKLTTSEQPTGSSRGAETIISDQKHPGHLLKEFLKVAPPDNNPIINSATALATFGLGLAARIATQAGELEEAFDGLFISYAFGIGSTIFGIQQIRKNLDNLAFDRASEDMATYLTNAMSDVDRKALLDKYKATNEEELTKIIVDKVMTREPAFIRDEFVEFLRSETPKMTAQNYEQRVALRKSVFNVDNIIRRNTEELATLQGRVQARQHQTQPQIGAGSREVVGSRGSNAEDLGTINSLKTTLKENATQKEIAIKALDEFESHFIEPSRTASFLVDLGMTSSQILDIWQSSPNVENDELASDIIEGTLRSIFTSDAFRKRPHLA